MSNLIRILICMAALSACTTPPSRTPTLEAAPAPWAPAVSGPLSYTLDFTRCSGEPCLRISLAFEGNREGKTLIRLPTRNSGQKDLYRAIHRLEAASPGTRLSPTEKPDQWNLEFEPGQKVAIRYEVIQDFKGPIEGQDQYYRAMISKDHFFVFGEQVFAHPVVQGELPREIRLEIRNHTVPYADSFGVGTRPRRLNLSLDEFRHGTFLGGKYRFSKFRVKGRPVHTALLGHFGFTQADFNRLLKQIFTAERNFWNDHDFPYFLVTAIPAMEEGRGGTGRTNSFSLFFNAKTRIDRDLAYLLAHELFHTWNGRRIERTDPEELQYWFSEGFTDYYMRVLAFRAGMIDYKEYLREFNEVIRHYSISRARNEKAERVLKDFWNDREVEKLPYQQGDLLAHRWNRLIREHSNGQHSIDDFMRDLLAEARSRGTKVSEATVDRLMRTYLAEGIRTDHERFVVNGGTIPVEAEWLGPCVRLELKPEYRFDLWLDEAATKRDHVIRGVKPEGPAYAAGLRDGMVIRAWDHDRKEFKARFTVMVNGSEKTIAYEGTSLAESVPQLVLDDE
ncbi:MAG: hypothetical protein EBX52_04355, partial [Proteobacteria bacterium]|nr:hypothetical protein [Pseudomonadota bacterium]